MKIVHYIPSIDRSWGGTSTFMQVLAKPLGKRAELHIVTHVSDNPLVMENCDALYTSVSSFFCFVEEGSSGGVGWM